MTDYIDPDEILNPERMKRLKKLTQEMKERKRIGRKIHNLVRFGYQGKSNRYIHGFKARVKHQMIHGCDGFRHFFIVVLMEDKEYDKQRQTTR